MENKTEYIKGMITNSALGDILEHLSNYTPDDEKFISHPMGDDYLVATLKVSTSLSYKVYVDDKNLTIVTTDMYGNEIEYHWILTIFNIDRAYEALKDYEDNNK